MEFPEDLEQPHGRPHASEAGQICPCCILIPEWGLAQSQCTINTIEWMYKCIKNEAKGVEAAAASDEAVGAEILALGPLRLHSTVALGLGEGSASLGGGWGGPVNL